MRVLMLIASIVENNSRLSKLQISKVGAFYLDITYILKTFRYTS